MGKLKKEIVDTAHIDINMPMNDSESGVPMVLWIEHFGM
jgi:hypothetical protein